MTDDYFTAAEMEFLNTEEDGKTLIFAELQQFKIGNTILLKSGSPRRSPFFAESQFLTNLYTLECMRRDR